jgi:hypothetical protein
MYFSFVTVAYMLFSTYAERELLPNKASTLLSWTSSFLAEFHVINFKTMIQMYGLLK